MDGEVVKSYKQGQTGIDIIDAPAKVTNKRVSFEEMLEIMEQRWNSLYEERAQRKNIVAVGVRFNIFTRDKFRCAYCGRSASEGAVLEVDHIHPRSQGGTDDEDNLITACWECNRGKSNKLLEQTP